MGRGPEPARLALPLRAQPGPERNTRPPPRSPCARRGFPEKHADESTPTPDAILARHEAIGTLRLFIAELEAEDARLIHLKYMEHQSYADIARAAGLPIGTVGYRLHHLLKQLAASLRRAGIESANG